MATATPQNIKRPATADSFQSLLGCGLDCAAQIELYVAIHRRPTV